MRDGFEQSKLVRRAACQPRRANHVGELRRQRARLRGASTCCGRRAGFRFADMTGFYDLWFQLGFRALIYNMMAGWCRRSRETDANRLVRSSTYEGDGMDFRGFLGGHPLSVFMRLALISVIVGVLLSLFGITPRNFFHALDGLARHVYDMGFGAVEWLLQYMVLGAMIVMPIWLIDAAVACRPIR